MKDTKQSYVKEMSACNFYVFKVGDKYEIIKNPVKNRASVKK